MFSIFKDEVNIELYQKRVESMAKVLGKVYPKNMLIEFSAKKKSAFIKKRARDYHS